MKLDFNCFKFVVLLIAPAMIIAGCEKSNEITIPMETVTFAGQSSGSYFIQDDPASVYKITVGATTKSDVDRTVTFNVSSPSGATEGVQYNLASNTIIIPAGEVTAAIDVNGIFAGYAGARKDTLTFTLTSGHLEPAEFNNTFNLYLQKYCDVVLASFDGTYDIQDYDDAGQPDGAAYTVDLAPETTSGTTGELSITGLWGIPVPFKVDLDWSDPANFITTIEDQDWFIDGTYGQVRIRSIGTGSFSSCDNTLVIKYEVYVAAGSFGVYSSEIQE